MPSKNGEEIFISLHTVEYGQVMQLSQLLWNIVIQAAEDSYLETKDVLHSLDFVYGYQGVSLSTSEQNHLYRFGAAIRNQVKYLLMGKEPLMNDEALSALIKIVLDHTYNINANEYDMN